MVACAFSQVFSRPKTTTCALAPVVQQSIIGVTHSNDEGRAAEEKQVRDQQGNLSADQSSLVLFSF